MYRRTTAGDGAEEKLKYCAMSDTGYQALDSAIKAKKMPTNICVEYKSLLNSYLRNGIIQAMDGSYGDSNIVPNAYNCSECFRLKQALNFPEGCNVKWRLISDSTPETKKDFDSCSAAEDFKKENTSYTGRCVYDNDKCILDNGIMSLKSQKNRVEGSSNSSTGGLTVNVYATEDEELRKIGSSFNEQVTRPLFDNIDTSGVNFITNQMGGLKNPLSTTN